MDMTYPKISDEWSIGFHVDAFDCTRSESKNGWYAVQREPEAQHTPIGSWAVMIAPRRKPRKNSVE